MTDWGLGVLLYLKLAVQLAWLYGLVLLISGAGAWYAMQGEAKQWGLLVAISIGNRCDLQRETICNASLNELKLNDWNWTSQWKITKLCRGLEQLRDVRGHQRKADQNFSYDADEFERELIGMPRYFEQINLSGAAMLGIPGAEEMACYNTPPGTCNASHPRFDEHGGLPCAMAKCDGTGQIPLWIGLLDAAITAVFIYMGHNYMGHIVMGQNYMGHKYIGVHLPLARVS